MPATATSGPDTGTSRPPANVLLIVADDLSWADTTLVPTALGSLTHPHLASLT